MSFNYFKTQVLKDDEILNVVGLNKKVQASYVWNFFGVQNKNLIVVTSSIYEANLLYKDLSYSHDNIYLYPMDDFLVSETLSSSPDLMASRIDTLNELVKNDDLKIVITNLTGYLRFLPTKELWKKSNIKIEKNVTLKRENMIKTLNVIGYKKDSCVTKTGEYAHRGYI